MKNDCFQNSTTNYESHDDGVAKCESAIGSQDDDCDDRTLGDDQNGCRGCHEDSHGSENGVGAENHGRELVFDELQGLEIDLSCCGSLEFVQ